MTRKFWGFLFQSSSVPPSSKARPSHRLKALPLNRTIVEKGSRKVVNIGNACSATAMTLFSSNRIRWPKPGEKYPSLSSASQCSRPQRDRVPCPSVGVGVYIRRIVRDHSCRMFSHDL